MRSFIILFVIYYAVMTVVSVALTILDKRAAIKGKWRVPEATLMMLGLFGGALPMFVAMRTIRHKTKYMKFMVGLPIEMALHVALICFLIFKFI